MNEPEDRPTTSNGPVPSADPPPGPGWTPAPTGPPGTGTEAGGGSFPRLPEPPPAADLPSASWEDVVDPVPEPPAPPPPAGHQPGPVNWPAPRPTTPAPPLQTPPPPPRPAPPVQTSPPPVPPPPPAPAPPAAGAAAPAPPAAGAPETAVASAEDQDAYDDGYDNYEDEPVSRWVSLLATIGTALIGIVSIQVIASIVEGLLVKKGERVGVPDDLLHRLGYPFGGLGSTALVFLVLGVVLVSLPSVLDELLSESQDRLVGVALIVAIVMGVIIAVGSLLAVRANLHEYSAKGVAVPSYVRVQFTNFLLGSLGAAALALFGSIAAINERSRDRAAQ